jgi:hypothetical protein
MFLSFSQLPGISASRSQRWQPNRNYRASALITRLVNPRPPLTQRPTILMAIRTASFSSGKRPGRKSPVSKRAKSLYVTCSASPIVALTASRRTPPRRGYFPVPHEILRALRKLKHNYVWRDTIISYLKRKNMK